MFGRAASMKYFTTHKAAFDEVSEAIRTFGEDYPDDNKENLSKVIHNLLSQHAAEIYTLEYLESALNLGLERLPISVAIRETEDLVERAKRYWPQFRWVTKFVLGRQPSDRSAATWLLASKFSDLGHEFLSSLNPYEQEILRLVYGKLLYIASGRQ
ncbi:hypothetical protein [Photobacterium galatheae]|uniref:Uncharacterized protein n=1 Tax=Photobacterium galatheae TaxID=1654360 RepID=A0A066RUA8_9GAMM|nr:hypothetical protein [Photobacterium galatheae]KDM90978.1 hypothetical protein EA58_14580 [Photobacterium galatheae]MCM0149065.1 hypothetical protein [Photobacterium galatheae]